MAIYTGVANGNGDFAIPFSSSYLGGEKVTVTAEKDGAIKSIELFAPSSVTGGGVIRFSGSLNEFPNNIGIISIHDIYELRDNVFRSANGDIFTKATGLVLSDGIVSIGSYSVAGWSSSKSVHIPDSVKSIGSYAFQGWSAANGLLIPNSIEGIGANAFQGWSSATQLILSNNLASIGSSAFEGWSSLERLEIPEKLSSLPTRCFQNLSSCVEIVCAREIPPTIQSNTFYGLNAACIIKVPSVSVAAYQSASYWSAFASRIQAI